ncbi:MAG TPA: deoxyribonuclease IV [Methanoregulaceae archaeon]|nr:deoxyribonuclease IV [Methanoregulaceae archaeon]
MVKVGVHVSIAGSIVRAVERAREAECDTFQIFSRNPRGWRFQPLDPEQSNQFREEVKRKKIYPPVDHMPYLPNLATPREEIYKKSVETLTAELRRCAELGIPYLVTHLGHHLGDGIENGRMRVIEAINTSFLDEENEVMLLLENTAGEKNGVGSTFEDIRAVLEGITRIERVGVCFDTCHAFGAGYDLRTTEGVREVMHAFDEEIGLDMIKLVHLNDSKGELGGGLDRHEHIGLGQIGEEGFSHILQHEVFRSRPLICETPVDDRRDDAGNIRKVRELAL